MPSINIIFQTQEQVLPEVAQKLVDSRGIEFPAGVPILFANDSKGEQTAYLMVTEKVTGSKPAKRQVKYVALTGPKAGRVFVARKGDPAVTIEDGVKQMQEKYGKENITLLSADLVISLAEND